jgi:1-acyl-sn-glycerol-3-phosphate acyltransferase
MPRLQTSWRVLSIIGHLGTATTIALYIRVSTRLGARPHWVPVVVRWWHRRLCTILGIRIQVQGRLETGCLLIGNHVSWLDIPVVGALGEVGFLAKSDIRAWHLVGWLAETVETRFIERGAHRTQALCNALIPEIQAGLRLMIFPEGTTSTGVSVLRFHPRLFALAQNAGVRVQPVALGYRSHGDRVPDAIAPFIGDDTFVAHLLRVVRHPGLVAEVRFLPALTTGPTEPRHRLADRTRRAIAEALGMDAPEPMSARPANAARDAMHADAASTEVDHVG